MTTVDSVPCMSREEVERRAADILRSYDLQTVPIDPVVLANRLGISVHNATFSDDNVAGMIAKRGDTVTLLVNADDSPFRKRFTIAHELGHHFLHLSEDGEFVDGEATLFRGNGEDQKSAGPEKRREIQANMFAAALLMPELAVRTEWERLDSVEALARRLNVSEAAMGIRLVKLGLV